MAATLPVHRENVVSLSAVRAERRLSSLPLSLDMDFSESERASVPIGRTVWLAVVASLALWGLIAGAIWLV
jgi:hypothetical protein